jgi:hypothetical protein
MWANFGLWSSKSARCRGTPPWAMLDSCQVRSACLMAAGSTAGPRWARCRTGTCPARRAGRRGVTTRARWNSPRSTVTRATRCRRARRLNGTARVGVSDRHASYPASRPPGRGARGTAPCYAVIPAIRLLMRRATYVHMLARQRRGCLTLDDTHYRTRNWPPPPHRLWNSVLPTRPGRPGALLDLLPDPLGRTPGRVGQHERRSYAWPGSAGPDHLAR